MKFSFSVIVFWLVAHLSTAQKLSSGPQVLTFFSDVDDTEQPYGLYLPKNYDSQKKYPLVLMLHGAGSNHRLALRRVFGKSNANGENDVEASKYFPEWDDVEYIVASPFARGTNGYQGVSERDVMDVLNDVKKRFSIDEDRTYLTGLSMGGGGTLWIGLTRPDVWAAIAPVCPAPPKGTDSYLMNGFNLPLHFFHGDADKAVPVTVSRDWVKKLKDVGANVEYDEYPGVEHNSWENAYKDELIFKWFSKYTRNPYPAQVKFSTSRYQYNKAYWVRFDKINPGTSPNIDARFTGQNQLNITTSDLDAFSLKLDKHPSYRNDLPLEVILNGKKVKMGTMKDSISFQHVSNKWVNSKYSAPANSKTKGSEGPVSEAIAYRHIYVYGTGGNPSKEELQRRIEIANKAANWSLYRNAFLGRIMVFPRVVADKDVRPSDYESANLVLFGTKETNTVIEKYSDKLPLHLSNSADDKRGLLYIFPVNGHYVLINSGVCWFENSSTQNPAFPQLPHSMLAPLKDYVLYNESLSNVITEGYFSDAWQLSEDQKKALNQNGVTSK